jgi:hypothetical protein
LFDESAEAIDQRRGKPILDRLVERRARINGMVAVSLVTFLGLDLSAQIWPGTIPQAIAEQSDLGGALTSGAAFASLIGFAAAGVALLLAARSPAGRRLAWAVIGSGCIAGSLVDFFLPQPDGLAQRGVLAGGLLLFVLVLRCLKGVPGAVRLAAIGALLLASNPVTGAFELTIAGDPANYEYVAADMPYAMTGSAWHLLWAVSRLQEASEVVAMALLLQSFLLAGAHTPHAGALGSRLSG